MNIVISVPHALCDKVSPQNWSEAQEAWEKALETFTFLHCLHYKSLSFSVAINCLEDLPKSKTSTVLFNDQNVLCPSHLYKSVRDTNYIASSWLETAKCYSRVCSSFQRKQLLSWARIPHLVRWQKDIN